MTYKSQKLIKPNGFIIDCDKKQNNKKEKTRSRGGIANKSLFPDAIKFIKRGEYVHGNGNQMRRSWWNLFQETEKSILENYFLLF